MGQFPSNYVELITFQKVRALYDYSPQSPGDLSFKAGDIVNVSKCVDNDWWDGELDGVSGSFPANYVEKV